MKKNPIKSQFDLIYIDGSHHVDDVIIDAFKSFDINLFLSAKKYSYKIVGIWNQIAIIKTSEELNKTIFE